MKRAKKKKKKKRTQLPYYIGLPRLAKILDVTPAHLGNLARCGILPTIRIGAAYRVPLAVAKKVMAEGVPSRERRAKVQAV